MTTGLNKMKSWIVVSLIFANALTHNSDAAEFEFSIKNEARSRVEFFGSLSKACHRKCRDTWDGCLSKTCHYKLIDFDCMIGCTSHATQCYQTCKG
jgi:hypothetical protein